MRKMTLLAMVQNILSALDSDEVTSISDTVESLQVAEIIKETYYEQFNNIMVPELRKLFRLNSVSNIARPNYLEIPDNILNVEWIRYRDYRNSDKYRELEYLDPVTFLERQLQYHSASSDVFLTTDPEGLQFYIHTDRTPHYYTIFNDRYIVTDGYDLDEESTLQSANTLAYGQYSEEFELEDDYVPPIDANLFPLLLAEAKSVAFINLKQISSSKEEQRARRQRIRMQNEQFRSKRAQISYRDRGPNFAKPR